MDITIVGKYLSTLPEDDDHPYRTGPWRPQTTEWDADDLTTVTGEVPADLDGIYLLKRRTKNAKAFHDKCENDTVSVSYGAVNHLITEPKYK
ncbi:hypothetical protein ABLN73_08675, partial [Mycobacterium tuberculosis]